MRSFIDIVENFRPKHQASYVDDDYLMFNLSSDAWSGGQYDEDTLKMYYYVDTGTWEGRTERDQSIVRDLTQDEISEIVAELDLEKSLEYYL